ncbi:MAG: sigma-70 family RNA polymerase sigma factor [Bacteroidetes bacterium]|nr:sigma-70 family RNA polymerase sigma factor [Bacteroidota bacterium]
MSAATHSFLYQYVRDIVYTTSYRKDYGFIHEIVTDVVSSVWQAISNGAPVPDNPTSYLWLVARNKLMEYRYSHINPRYNNFEEVITEALDKLENDHVLASYQKKRYARTADLLNREEFDTDDFLRLWIQSTQHQQFPEPAGNWTPAMKTQLRENLTLTFSEMNGWSWKRSVTNAITSKAGIVRELFHDSSREDEETDGQSNSLNEGVEWSDPSVELSYTEFISDVSAELVNQVMAGKPPGELVATAWYLVFNTDFTLKSVQNALLLRGTSSAEYLLKKQLRILNDENGSESLPLIWRRRLARLPDWNNSESAGKLLMDLETRFISDLKRLTKDLYEKYGRETYPGL